MLKGSGNMCDKCDKGDCEEKLRKFNRYLVIDAGDDGAYRVIGIRSDAPEDMIEEFIGWYREHNRYENGRLRPKDIARKVCVVEV